MEVVDSRDKLTCERLLGSRGSAPYGRWQPVMKTLLIQLILRVTPQCPFCQSTMGRADEQAEAMGLVIA